jgi:hypothetical protein
MGQVPQDALAAYLQVCGLLPRCEVSTNRIATRVAALDSSSVVGVSVSLQDQLDEKMLIEQ